MALIFCRAESSSISTIFFLILSSDDEPINDLTQIEVSKTAAVSGNAYEAAVIAVA